MAVDFDGSNDGLNCGNAASLDDLWAGSASLTAWIQLDALTAAARFFDKRAGSNGWILYDHSVDTSKLEFLSTRVTTNGQWGCAAGVLTTGVWIHIVMTYNGSNVANDPIFYVNGIVSATTEVSTPAGALHSDAADSLFVALCADGSSSPLNGRMEDVRVFNRIITPAEAAILAAGYRGPLGGEVMWLPMDGARATPVFDGATLAVNVNYLNDVSHNGNHGNPTGNPLGYASDCPRTNLWIPRKNTMAGVWVAPVVRSRLWRRFGPTDSAWS